MNKPLQIAFAFPFGSPQEIFIEGVAEYARKKRRRWSFVIAPETNSVSISQLKGWTGDGIIAALNTPGEAKVATSFEIPVVNISSALRQTPVPRVRVDNRAIGQVAAQHFLASGYEQFAYYGMTGVEYSSQRLAGFKKALAEQDFDVAIQIVASTFQLNGADWLQQQNALTKWVEALTPPCAVFAASDARARQVINSCLELGVQVPGQIAVMGVDDQQVICEHTHPTLSSIARNSVQEGYLAAQMLDQMLCGKEMQSNEVLVPPLGVTTRESTDAVAISDARLRKAVRFLQSNVERPLSVTDLCRECCTSRRWIEYAFREKFGESPFNYMRRQRLEHAKRLLREERKASMNSIAQRCGYSTSNQLAKAFRTAYGKSPRDYRRELDGT